MPLCVSLLVNDGLLIIVKGLIVGGNVRRILWPQDFVPRYLYDKFIINSNVSLLQEGKEFYNKSLISSICFIRWQKMKKSLNAKFFSISKTITKTKLKSEMNTKHKSMSVRRTSWLVISWNCIYTYIVLTKNIYFNNSFDVEKI